MKVTNTPLIGGIFLNIMPLKSQAQRKFLWANHPDIARKFERETPKGKKLPKHAKKKKR